MPGSTLERQRGVTLIELMIALALLLAAVAGFWSAVTQSLFSTGVAQRRTVQTWVRSDLVDRITLTKRASIAATPTGAWIIDRCFDAAGQPTGSNSSYDASFACAATDVYQRWLQVTPSIQQVNDFGFAGPIWRVSIYVENMRTGGCTPDTRYTSLACTAADYYLTD